MKKAYVTILRSLHYLPGVLVLHHSLRKVAAAADLLVLTSPGIPEATLELLAGLGMKTQRIAGGAQDGWLTGPRQISNYYKLCVLSLTQYQKVVYLDADMLVCHNIDDLFGKENWSAVNARGLLSGLYDWMDFDSGLMVLEPSARAFETLLQKARGLKTDGESYRSYLGLFHPQWYDTQSLHLAFNYNVFAAYLDSYFELHPGQLFNQQTPGTSVVKVLHFWGSHKPWNTPDPGRGLGRYGQALEVWHKCFGELLGELPEKASRLYKPWAAVAAASN